MDEEKSVMPADEKAEQGAATAPQVTPYKPDAKVPLTKRQFWRVLLSIETCMLAIVIDIFSIPVAAPTVSPDLLGQPNTAWLGTPFLLSFALGYLIWPRLCRGFGYKFSFAVAIEAFNVAASRVPGSKTAGNLIAMRAISGAGAGGTYGLFDMVLRDIVPPKEVEKYFSVSRMVWAVTALVSPLVAATFVDYQIGPLCFDLFFLPGMVGYLMILVFLNLPAPSWSDAWLNIRRFDYLGTLCLTVGMACILLAPASSGTLIPWVSGHFFDLSISGLALLMTFSIVETLVPDPLLNPSLFLDQGLLVIMAATFFHGANLFGTLYYLPHFFQLVLDDTAINSTITTLPLILALGWCTVAMFMSSPSRTSFKIVRIGAAFARAATGMLMHWTTDTWREEMIATLAIMGLGQGAALIGLLRTAQASGKHFTRVFTFFYVFGSSFGVALFSAGYVETLRSWLELYVPEVAQILADTGKIDEEACASCRSRVREAYGSSMPFAWWLMLACALAVSALSFLVEPSQLLNEGDSSRPGDAEKVPDAEKGQLFAEKDQLVTEKS